MRKRKTLIFTGIVLSLCILVAFALTSVKKELSDIERSMLANGDYAEQLGRLTDIIKTLPDTSKVKSQAYLDLGLAYYGLMDYTTAQEIFELTEASDLPKENKDLFLYLVKIMKENKDALEMIQKSQEQIMTQEKEAERELLLNIYNGHFQMVRVLLSETFYFVPAIMPHMIWLKENIINNFAVFDLSADLYFGGEFYAEAARDYEKAIILNPKSAELYDKLADSYLGMGQWADAKENYTKAMELLKQDRSKDYGYEITAIQKRIKTFPVRYLNIAYLASTKDYAQAEELCNEKLKNNPNDYVAMTQLGNIYWKTDRRRQAIGMFRKAMKINPDYPVVHFYLGKAYIFEKKFDKATAEFDIFKEQMDSLPAYDEDTRLFYVSSLHYIGYIYSTHKDYKNALRQFIKASEVKPDDQRSYFNMAVCYYIGYNSRSRAYTQLQKVIELNTDPAMTDRAKFYIDYMRRNPDARIMGDFKFIHED